MVLVVVCNTDLRYSFVARIVRAINHGTTRKEPAMNTTTHHVNTADIRTALVKVVNNLAATDQCETLGMVNVLAMLTAATLHIDWDTERFDNLFNKVYAELSK